MRLRTYESYWLLKNGIMHSYPLLEKDIKTSVVIGGGITGALICETLRQQKIATVLLDKRDIGHGSTAATTCMLQYEIDEMLIDLADKIGEESAAKCYQAGRDAIHTLSKLVSQYQLDCEFERKASLYIAHNKKAAKKLHDEYLLRKKNKLGVQWKTDQDIVNQYGLHCYGAIQSDTAASADAYSLAHQLIYKMHKKGLQVYDQTEIARIDWGRRNKIHTSEGYSVTCDNIIFCNGFEATEMLKEKIADLFYTYACVSEQGIVLPDKLKKVIVWDTNDPYLYLRTTGDGRLMAGGEDTDDLVQSNQQKMKEKKSKKIIKKVQQMIPGLHFVEDFSWGGVFGSTKDGLPYIGVSPEYKNAIFVLSFGGNGITFSVQARDIVTDIMNGKNNDLSYHYRFGR